MFTAILFLILSVFQQEPTQATGTRLFFDLPPDFVVDKTLPGFRSVIDSAKIRVYEFDNPMTFDEWKTKQINTLLETGFDTSNVATGNFNGYQSVNLTFIDKEIDKENFTIFFGSDEFIASIVLEYDTDRINELKEVVFSAKYDEQTTINSFENLGFNIDFGESELKITNHSAMTLRAEERNELDEIISYLNLTRFGKSTFQGLTQKEAVEVISSQYFSKSEDLTSEGKTIDNQRAHLKTLSTSHGWFDEYNVIILITSKEFDVLAVGGVNRKDKLSEIVEVVESIKFN